MTSKTIAADAPRSGRPGRPPDPEIEPRVLTAALDVYTEVGWGGFTIDAVVRTSRVGKAAIYRRWPTKEQLVADAITSMHVRLTDQLTGSFRDDLSLIADSLSRRYVSRHGLAYLRAQIEAKVFPDVLGVALDSQRRETIARGRAVVVAAIERGEVSRDTSPALVMDALAGTIINHLMLTPKDDLDELGEERGEFIERVVNLVIAGIGWTGSTEEGS